MVNYMFEDVYFYFNIVRLDFIRIEVDVVIYNFYIFFCFKFERMMFNEGVKVKDLFEFWNEEMERFFGIRLKIYVEGIF